MAHASARSRSALSISATAARSITAAGRRASSATRARTAAPSVMSTLCHFASGASGAAARRRCRPTSPARGPRGPGCPRRIRRPRRARCARSFLPRGSTFRSGRATGRGFALYCLHVPVRDRRGRSPQGEDHGEREQELRVALPRGHPAHRSSRHAAQHSRDRGCPRDDGHPARAGIDGGEDGQERVQVPHRRHPPRRHPAHLAQKIRASILFAGPLLARRGRVILPPPAAT